MKSIPTGSIVGNQSFEHASPPSLVRPEPPVALIDLRVSSKAVS
jgi:hypothetical protein